GPLITDANGSPRLTGLFAGSWTAGSQYDRSQVTAADGSFGSAFAELQFLPKNGDDVRTIGWVEKYTAPLESRLALLQAGAQSENAAAHMQVSWARPASAAKPRAFAFYTQRRQELNLASPVFGVFERVFDGPITRLDSLAHDVVRQWSVGVRAGTALPAS